MQRTILAALFTSLLAGATLAEPLSLEADRYAQPLFPRRSEPAYVSSQPIPPQPIASTPAPARPARYAAAEPDVNPGGGFFEFLFGGGSPFAPPRPQAEMNAHAAAYGAPAESEPAKPELDPKYFRQVVAYSGPEKPGTIIIDTPQRFLFLVRGDGTAVRYGIGVGRPGFTWAGEKKISAKKEWPDWTPPPEMLERQPSLPYFMAGGPDNPLGARALYLGSSLYRIHGSNEPWTIGQAVSSGCIRMRNEDVIDLYEKVRIGTKVVVI
jgi:lipoprotein-anchoring transpeptidase ErfK/SrfK